ncbi:META domain-containing protein [Nocardioides panacisoli]|uniref:META domain-containing protein n=1 Tax=Nocardioides panacisoli TaxID=627624 RepID=UPI001C639BE7|nr:META domain-containing protein [Nocardioides panacisoli]QYJ05259.1 META domain-containing protein [Nocardioides panacisoli]
MTNDQRLTELLEHTAGQVYVRPPPVESMVGAADRVRRRRRAGTAVVTSILVILLGGVAFAIHDANAPRTPVAGEDHDLANPDTDTATVFRAEFSSMTGAETRAGECPTLTGFRPEAVPIPSTGDRARHAVQALVADQSPGRPAIRAFSRPDGSYRVRSVVHDGSVINVDLDKDPWDPYPTIDMACPPDGAVAMQQIVRTAQEALDSEDAVLLTVNGTPARGIWLHRLKGPVAAWADTTTGTDALNGSWDVVALVGKSGKSVLPAELQGEVSLTLDNGNLVGDTGCNSLRGTYDRRSNNNGAGQRLSIEDLAATTADCDVEAPLLERLKAVRYTTAVGGDRYLHSATWMIVARLQRR